MRIPWSSAPIRIAAATIAAGGVLWAAARYGRKALAGPQTTESEAREHERRDELVREASEESFPASDPPSYTQDHTGEPDRTR